MSYVGKVTAGGSTHLVGSTLYGTCDTAAATAAKVVTCSAFDKLETGVTIHVKFTNGNSATNPTLNVNSTGAKSIIRYSGKKGAWEDTSVVSFTYDGTSWVQNDSRRSLEGIWVSDSSTTVLIPESGAITIGGSGGISIAGDGQDAYIGFNVPTTGSITTGTTSTNLPTAAAVASFVESQMGDVAGALVYKGTVSAGSALLNTALKKGWYYIVDTAGSYAGVTCEPGDMVIVNTAGTYTTASALAAAVDVIQTNIDTISNSDIDTIVAS